MQLEQLFQKIESQSFAAQLSIASDLKTFLRLALGLPEVKKLESALRSNQQFVISIILRIYKISKFEIDYRYENPYDTALAIYLFFLNSVSPSLAKEAAAIVQKIPHCWWAEKIGRDILTVKPTQSGTDVTVYFLEDYSIPSFVEKAGNVTEDLYFLSFLKGLPLHLTISPMPTSEWRVQNIRKTFTSSEVNRVKTFGAEELFKMPIREIRKTLSDEKIVQLETA